MRSAVVISLLAATLLDTAAAVAPSSPSRQQRLQRPLDAASCRRERPALLRLRGGVRTLQEGEWEELHETAGEKLVVVGASLIPASQPHPRAVLTACTRVRRLYSDVVRSVPAHRTHV